MSILALALASMVSADVSIPDTASPVWAVNAYGEEIQFDVMRKGKQIGTHSVTFRQLEDGYEVLSATDLKVKFLFFTAYKFTYRSTETWRDGQLVSVFSTTNDDGKKSETTWDISDGLDLLPTSHWNPAVLSRDAVFNTITGNVNDVMIEQAGTGLLPAGDMDRNAWRYDYSGDLERVSSWYDASGRWVGLQFAGRDGSEITYECVKCGL